MEYNYKQGKWKCNKEVRNFTKTHYLWNTITSRGNGSAIKKLDILQKHITYGIQLQAGEMEVQ